MKTLQGRGIKKEKTYFLMGIYQERMLCMVAQFLYSEAMDHNEVAKGIDTLKKKVVKDSIAMIYLYYYTVITNFLLRLCQDSVGG